MPVSARRFQGRVNEDGSATIVGRVTARDGTGAASPVPEEGNLLLAADLSAITCRVFDLKTLTEVTPAPTITTAAILAALQTTGIFRLLKDAQSVVLGGNFLHDLPPASFPAGATDGSQKYLIEYKYTTTGGTVAWGQVEVTANAIQQS